MLAGRLSDGGVVSRTVTVNEPEEALVCESVAVQFTVVVAMANVEPEAGVQTTPTTPSTMSDAVAVNVTAAPLEPVASVVIFAGRLSDGGVVSRTVTVNEPVLVLLCE